MDLATKGFARMIMLLGALSSVPQSTCKSCMSLTSHQLRTSETNFSLYFLVVYFCVLLMNPSEKRSACPERSS